MKYLLQTLLSITLCLVLGAETIAQKPQLVVQNGHNETVYTLAISPDKKYLASGGIDRKIIIWDITSGKQLYSLTEHTLAVLSLAFSPDGKYLASGSADGSVKIWDIVRGIKLEDISLQPKGVTCVIFSPDSKLLAITGTSKTINIWDIDAKKVKYTFTGYKATVEKIVFSPDGKSLVSFGQDYSMVVWEFGADKPVQFNIYKEQMSLDTSLSISPDGNYVAAASSYSNVTIWNIKTGAMELIPLPAESAEQTKPETSDLVFVSNEELIYESNDQIYSWNFRTKKVTKLADCQHSTGNGLVISKDYKLLVFSYDDVIETLDLETKESKKFKGGFEYIYNLDFFPNGLTLASNGISQRFFGDKIELDKKEKGRMTAKLKGTRYEYISETDTLANFGMISTGAGSPNIELEKLDGNSEPKIIKAHSESITAMSVQKDGNLLATSSEDGTIKIWDVRNWEKPQRIINENARQLAFSPNGNWLAVAIKDKKLKLYDTKTWRSQDLFEKGDSPFGHLIFSSDSTKIAAHVSAGSVEQYLMVWDIANNRNYVFKLDPLPKDFSFRDLLGLSPFRGLTLMSTISDYANMEATRGPISFSADGRFIACQYKDLVKATNSIKIWDLETGAEVNNFIGHTGAIRATAISPNNKVLASGGNDTTIKLWDIKNGKELATLSTLDRQRWVIFTPEGRFDTNFELEDDETLHWAIPGRALETLPLDVFMRDYYEPKLFERLLICTETDNCYCPEDSLCDQQVEFRKVRNLSEINIVRPEVKIVKVSLPDANREVNVTVEVSKASGLVEQGNGQQITRTTDVYDLRLFRDKQLVSDAPFDGAEKIERRKMEIESSEWKSKFETELKIWRESTKVELNPQTGKQTLSFKVQLPKGKDSSNVKFTAYAFNEDRVKSETAKYEWTAEQKANLPNADPNIKRRAYIFSIGVNDSKLSYSAKDANQFQKIVPEKLRQAGIYEIVPIQLVTATDDNGRLVVNATKQNIKTVFDLLAGKNVAPEMKRKIPNFQQIERSTPDDLIIFTYSGHGYSGKNSDFYLVLSDSNGKSPNPAIPASNLLISGEELALWLHDIEIDEMALIIDACQSAAAVESLGFKPGPLGSRGFGQLAYDKRLKVLVATQSDNDAIQADGIIKGGLLTYALIDEGLIEGKADSESEKDGKIMLDEWLEYGEAQIPRIFKIASETQILSTGVKKRLVWKKLNNSNNFNAEQQKVLQRASLFNFSRQNNDTLLFLTNINGKN